MSPLYQFFQTYLTKRLEELEGTQKVLEDYGVTAELRLRIQNGISSLKYWQGLLYNSCQAEFFMIQVLRKRETFSSLNAIDHAADVEGAKLERLIHEMSKIEFSKVLAKEVG